MLVFALGRNTTRGPLAAPRVRFPPDPRPRYRGARLPPREVTHVPPQPHHLAWLCATLAPIARRDRDVRERVRPPPGFPRQAVSSQMGAAGRLVRPAARAGQSPPHAPLSGGSAGEALDARGGRGRGKQGYWPVASLPRRPLLR